MRLLRRNGPPAGPFSHSGDCVIVRADPSVRLEWDEIAPGHFRRECRCGAEDYYRPGDRERLDPLDVRYSRHEGQCMYASESDPDVLRLVLRVKRGLGSDDYSWVSCSACDCSWAVADFAESVG
jgi:hypothetical protein